MAGVFSNQGIDYLVPFGLHAYVELLGIRVGQRFAQTENLLKPNSSTPPALFLPDHAFLFSAPFFYHVEREKQTTPIVNPHVN